MDVKRASTADIVTVARNLGVEFDARAMQADENDAFVSENYADLKKAGLVQAGVPAAFGGGDCDVVALADMLRELGRHCGSTALAFSMHTHQVALFAWRWRCQKAPVEALLKRIAEEQLILLSSGGSDWIGGSGKAEATAGGYRITARKVFTSGAPAGDLLMTGAVLEGEPSPMVLHFAIPMTSPHVRIVPNWRALGMRGTGSHDVLIDGHVVPEAQVSLKRKAGEWHPLFHIISMISFPLVYAVYVGIAERACDIAIDMAKKRRLDQHAIETVGRMRTELRAAQWAHAAMLSAACSNDPSPATTNEIMMGRALVARHAIASVELALEVAGGAGFYRQHGLERRFRDIQGARYHALQAGPQAAFSGCTALGLPTDTVF